MTAAVSSGKKCTIHDKTPGGESTKEMRTYLAHGSFTKQNQLDAAARLGSI